MISGQECADTVGSLNHNNSIVTADRTFILAGYTVLCNRTVVAWEFCYHVLSNVGLVEAIPGIWKKTDTNGRTVYNLVKSNRVTYDPRGIPANEFPCRIFNLSDTDQFTAPAGSVVGLYSNVVSELLHTNTNSSITTYRVGGNVDIVDAASNNNVSYNIAIRVHLGKYSGKYKNMALKYCVYVCVHACILRMCVYVVCVSAFAYVCVCVCE